MIPTTREYRRNINDNDIENIFLTAINAAENFLDSVQKVKSQDSAKHEGELLR
jgi:hypothetical protein